MKNKNLIMALTLGVLISGCKGGNTSSSSVSSTNSTISSSYSSASTTSNNSLTFSGNISSIVSTSITSSSSNTPNVSTSSIFEGYEDFDIALGNTRYYGLKFNNMENIYIEINIPNMYFSSFASLGYVVLDSDPDYLHAFSKKNIDDAGSYEIVMDVHGRSSIRENIEKLEERNLVHLIAPYVDKFEQVTDNVWELDSTILCRELSDFFQFKELKHANLVEFTIGKDNRLEALRVYEESGSFRGETLYCTFENIELEDVRMYNLWVEQGSIINERILDYKMLYSIDEETMVSVYEDEVIDFEATVVAKDCDGNIYVANEGVSKENVGIKLIPNDNCDTVEIGDIVSVEGTVVTNNLVVTLHDATIKNTGLDADYPPIFDEEVIVDSYGGGTYAAQIFSMVPYYSGSVYSTYAYVSDIPESVNEEEDTIIEVVCPTYDNGEECFHMQIIIPASLDLASKVRMFDEFKNAGIYGNGYYYELSLERFILGFDPSYYFAVKLLATDSSEVTKRLNVQEKIEKEIGIANFPILEGNTNYTSYRFGGSSGLYLETNYNYDSKKTQGVFIGYSTVTNDEYNSFVVALEEYGAVLYDVIKDAYKGKHYIYKYGETYIDYQYSESYYSDSNTLNIWIYNGELLRCPTITERLQEEIGSWFNVSSFPVLEGIHDYDYTIFKLYDYANNSYSLDDPLYCVAIDTKENIRDIFNKALINNGYNQYMDGNYPYTYITRGQDHYVFEKDGVFLDVACYPTSDYTYSGHSDYEYRLEVLIYEGAKPLTITTYENLNVLSTLYAKINASLAYDITLPEDAIVEIWKNLGSFKLADVEYGYGSRDEAFIYTSDVEGCYELVKQGMVQSGYKISSEREKSVSFKKVYNGQEYYAFMFKEVEKGYVRFMNDVGGVDWTV